MKSAPSRREKSTGLQAMVNAWLLRLAALLPLQPEATSLLNLSSIKKDKHQLVKPDDTHNAARLLLRLLAEKVAADALVECPPQLLDILAGPALTAHEAGLSREITQEIAELDC